MKRESAYSLSEWTSAPTSGSLAQEVCMWHIVALALAEPPGMSPPPPRVELGYGT